tara:strand:+ start:1299 stop:1919 length:621 start_codon:yes stop_codon:yes gene_type:complete
MNQLKNLMMRKSVSGKEMAELRGITPETVSRHVTGKTQMKMEDAVQYAAILDCTAEEILFETRSVTLYGIADAQHHVTPVDGIHNRRVHTMMANPDWMTAIIKENGSKSWNNKTIYFCDARPIKEGTVSSDTTNKLSVYKRVGGTLLAPDALIGFALIFPEPLGTYSLSDPFSAGGIEQAVELEWATPVLFQTYQNDALNIEVTND